MIKVTVVEETQEVSVEINGVEIPVDEIDYIPTGYCEEDDSEQKEIEGE